MKFFYWKGCVFDMSLSAHINGKPLKKLGGGVQLHQERFDEKQGLDVLQNTDSFINVSQTKYNVSLFKSDVLNDGKTVKQYLSDELKKVNEKRVSELGKRAFRNDANVLGIGTFQISDDSLERLGFDKDKPWDEQSENAQNLVKEVYKRMVNNAVGKPDIYGKILTATLHVDESTPHVDFITSGIDEDRPEWSMRDVLNGRTGVKRGTKLKAMQDDLNTIFSDKDKERFLLTRGDPDAKKKDLAKQTRIAMKDLDAEREVLKTRRKKLNDKESSLNDKEKALGARESVVDARERAIGEKEAELARGASERLLKAQRAIDEANEEKAKLERVNAALRAENSELDRVVLGNEEKAIIKYLREHNAGNGKRFYDNFKTMVNKERTDKRRITHTGIVDVVGQNDEYRRTQLNPLKQRDNDGFSR